MVYSRYIYILYYITIVNGVYNQLITKGAREILVSPCPSVMIAHDVHGLSAQHAATAVRHARGLAFHHHEGLGRVWLLGPGSGWSTSFWSVKGS